MTMTVGTLCSSECRHSNHLINNNKERYRAYRIILASAKVHILYDKSWYTVQFIQIGLDEVYDLMQMQSVISTPN